MPPTPKNSPRCSRESTDEHETPEALLTQISDERRKTRDERKGTRSKKSGVILSQPKGKKSKDPGTIIPLDKSEAPFEIPANWEWVRLGDVCELLNGDRSSNYPNKNEYVVCGVAWINTGHIRPDGFLDEKTMNYITEEKYNSLGNGKIHKFDLVYCLRGATFGKVARVEPFEKGAIASSLMIIRPILSQMRDFLYRCLKTDFAMNQLRKFDNGSAQPNLAAKDVSRYFVPLPPLTEQQRIVEKVQEAFAEIDSIENNKELLKTHIKQTRQKILDHAIHGKLVPQNKSDEPASVLLERITRDNPHYEKMEDEPFEIPENWVWCRLGNICDKLIDGDHNPPKGLNCTTEYIMLSSRNINDNDIVDLENVRYLSKDMFEEENLRTKLEKGDILFTSVGSLGRSCVFSGDGKYCFQRSVSVIHTNIYNKYLKYFFDSNYYQKYIVENATGTAQLGFYLEQMRKSFIAIPPLNEQSRIVAKIEELFSTLDQMERNLV